MRFALLMMLALGASISLSAQNVGFGKTNPSQKLDVDGAIRVGTTATADTGTIRFNPSNMKFEGYDGTQWHDLQGREGYWILSGDSLYNVTAPYVGVGTANPQASLDVEGSLRYADGNEGEAKILVSDAQGNAHWQTLSLNELLGAGSEIKKDFDCAFLISETPIDPDTWNFEVQGDYAYIFNPDSLFIYDVSNPAQPNRLSVLHFFWSGWSYGGASTMVVDGDYAYFGTLTGSNRWLITVNISDPSAPYMLLPKFVDTGTGGFNQISKQGNNVFLSRHNGTTLHILDVSNPAFPTLLHTESLPYTSNHYFTAKGNYLYMVDWADRTLDVWDVSNPASGISLLGSAPGGKGSRLIIEGDYLYLNASSFGTDSLFIYDIGSSVVPSGYTSMQITLTSPTYYSSMVIEDGYIYGRKLGVLDVTDPTSPAELNVFTAEETGTRLQVEGNYAYFANVSTDMLMIYNLSCQQFVTVDAGTGQPSIESAPAVNGSQNYVSKFTTTAGSSLGNSAIYEEDGDVGIGTTSPQYTLDVNGTIGGADAGTTFDYYLHNVHAMGLLQHHDGNSGYSPSNHHQLVLGNNGAWNVYFNRLFLMRSDGSYANDIRVAFADATTSSGTLKQNIIPLDESAHAGILQELLDAEVVHYEFVNEPFGVEGFQHIGLIAEDAPAEIQTPNADGLELGDYMAYLLVGIKALKTENDELRKELDEIKALLEQLTTNKKE